MLRSVNQQAMSPPWRAAKPELPRGAAVTGLDRVGDKAVQNDYCKTATVAEVQLLQGNVEAALVLYRAAVVAAPLERGFVSRWRRPCFSSGGAPWGGRAWRCCGAPHRFPQVDRGRMPGLCA
jgi:hypothetical protein